MECRNRPCRRAGRITGGLALSGTGTTDMSKENVHLQVNDAVVAFAEAALDQAASDLRTAVRQCCLQLEKNLQHSGHAEIERTVRTEDMARRAAEDVVEEASTWLTDRFQEAAEAASERVFTAVGNKMRAMEALHRKTVIAQQIALFCAVVSLIAVLFGVV